jgi:hypothetical protein
MGNEKRWGNMGVQDVGLNSYQLVVEEINKPHRGFLCLQKQLFLVYHL